MHDDSDINDEGDGGEEPDRQHIRPLGHGLTHLDTMIEFLRNEHGHNLEKTGLLDSQCYPEHDPCVFERDRQWRYCR